MERRQDWQHFFLSLVVLIGGGYLMAGYEELRGSMGTILGTVTGCWFTKANGYKNGNGNGEGNGVRK
jgi:hypothetical protein